MTKKNTTTTNEVEAQPVIGYDNEGGPDDGLTLTEDWGEDLRTVVNVPIMQKQTRLVTVTEKGKTKQVEQEIEVQVGVKTVSVLANSTKDAVTKATSVADKE